MTDIALVPDDISRIFQSLAVTALGLGAPASPKDPLYAKVRIGWPPEGQPAWGITEDVAFLVATPVDDPTDKLRDAVIEDWDGVFISEKQTAQRVWRVAWTLYGPRALDHARLIRSAVLTQSGHDALAVRNLFVVTDIPQTLRAPELFQGQWWERVDFSLLVNEGVEESHTDQWVTSTEVIVNTNDGVQRAVLMVAGG